MSLRKINGIPIEHFYIEQDGITYTEKTPEMKLKDGLITKDEYNKIINETINQKREARYESETDKQVIEIMRNFLIKNKTELSEEDKTTLDNINTQIESIKKEYPKQE